MFCIYALTARRSFANKHLTAGPSGFQPKISLLQAAWSWSLHVHVLLISRVELRWKALRPRRIGSNPVWWDRQTALTLHVAGLDFSF